MLFPPRVIIYCAEKLATPLMTPYLPALPSPLNRFYPRQHEPSRNTHRRVGRSSRDSGSTIRSSRFGDRAPQTISGSWIDGEKLLRLLDRKFGPEYQVNVRDQPVLQETGVLCSLMLTSLDEVQYILRLRRRRVDGRRNKDVLLI